MSEERIEKRKERGRLTILYFLFPLLSSLLMGQSWLYTKTAGSAAREARQSIYIMTNSAYDLRQVSENARKGVKMHILVTISAAKESPQLKSLEARGAAIWVATKAGPQGTMMVIDEDYVYDARGAAPNEDPMTSGWRPDPSMARDYIREWHNAVWPDSVIPCKRTPKPAAKK